MTPSARGADVMLQTWLAMLVVAAVLACGCSRRSRVTPQPASPPLSATAVQPTRDVSESLSAMAPTEPAGAAAVPPEPPASALPSPADANLGHLESALDGLEEVLAGMADWEVGVP